MSSPFVRTGSFIIPLTVLAYATLIPLLPVTAATTTATSTSEQATSTEISTSTTTTEVVTTPIDTTQVVLSPLAQTRITNLAANVSNRLDATLRRLTNVQDRITTRLAKLNQTGTNTDAATAELQVATGHLDVARAHLSTIDREVAAFIGSSNPKAGFIRLKTTYTTIYTELVAAHRSLGRTLDAIDGTIITPAPVTSTTTASTTE